MSEKGRWERERNQVTFSWNRSPATSRTAADWILSGHCMRSYITCHVLCLSGSLEIWRLQCSRPQPARARRRGLRTHTMFLPPTQKLSLWLQKVWTPGTPFQACQIHFHHLLCRHLFSDLNIPLTDIVYIYNPVYHKVTDNQYRMWSKYTMNDHI